MLPRANARMRKWGGFSAAAVLFLCVAMICILGDALFGVIPREFTIAKDGPRK
jgi:hypothetical protein